MLSAAGYGDAIISASNDLDEHLIATLKLQGCAINSWGVGTHLITAEDSPSLGGVFKLVGQYDDGQFVPKIKMSDNAEKISNPGIKNVMRIFDKDTKKMRGDIIVLEGEKISTKKDLQLVSDKAPWRFRVIPKGTFTVQSMLQPIFKQGQVVYNRPSLPEICAYAKEQIDSLWPEYLRLVNPEEMWVQRSSKLNTLRNRILKEESAKFH